ncbi:glycosyltransferase family 4 protein [Neisseria sp. Ec49-e6-T10]|uniref:glycosyltransferase family 4 protein n=1 Tax=Neisseria sp. Ec49-e6-T10 TaxID=3140744 RepID=UPI003EB97A44
MSKIVLIRQKYSAMGGAERFVSRALQALHAHKDLDIHLITRKWEPLAGITAHIINPFYLGNVWRDFSFAYQCRQFWQKNHFDLIQSHERIAGAHVYRAGDGVHAHWLKLRRASRGIKGAIAQFFNPYHHYVKYAEKAMFTHPELKKVICNSHMIKKEIQTYFGLPEHKITVIYNGVDTKTFSPTLKKYRQEVRASLKINEQTPLLLYVGSGFERKGVARALKGLVQNPEVSLLIVGHDKRLNQYRSLAKKLNVDTRCFFMGKQENILPFLGAADAFILPTLYDPFPNACIEALASGLPVITSHTCGASELITEGQNGFIADALQDKTWSNAIGKWLIAHKQNAQQLSEHAHISVGQLTLENMSNELVALYQTLLV